MWFLFTFLQQQIYSIAAFVLLGLAWLPRASLELRYLLASSLSFSLLQFYIRLENMMTHSFSTYTYTFLQIDLFYLICVILNGLVYFFADFCWFCCRFLALKLTLTLLAVVLFAFMFHTQLLIFKSVCVCVVCLVKYDAFPFA